MSHKLIGAAAAMVVAAAGVSAHASVFYGVTGTSLVRIDTVAQSASTVGLLQVGPTALSSVVDCDFDSSGTLWAIRQQSGNPFAGIPEVNQAYSINLDTGSGLGGGNFGSVQLHSLAFRASTGAFYSVNAVGGFPAFSAGNLITANISTGAAASVAGNSHGLGTFRVDALAFAPDGTLYGTWDAGSAFLGTVDFKLVRFDTATGLGTVIGSIATPSQRFNSLRFDSAGTAYSVDSVSGSVYTINTSTGQGTFAFSGGAAAVGISGLALQIPTPGTLCLLGTGMMAVGRRRR